MAKVKKEEENESYFSDSWLWECVKMEEDENTSIKEEQIKLEEKSSEESSDSKEEGAEMEVDDHELIKRQERNQTATNNAADEGDVSNSDQEVREKQDEPVVVVDSVENLCRYKCPECSDIFRCRSSFCHHLNKSKHSAGGKHKKDTGNYLTKTVFHRCKICAKIILSDRDIIKQHVTTISHNLGTLHEYTNMKNKEREKLQQKFKDFYKGKQLNNFHCKEYLRSESRKHGQEEVTRKPLTDKSADEFSIQETQKRKSEQIIVTDEVASLCEFKCPKCYHAYRCKDSLVSHLKSKHAVVLSCKDLNSSLVNVTFHRCKICHKNILCEKGVIKHHVSYNHNIENLEEYINMTKSEVESLQQKFNLARKSKPKKIIHCREYYITLQKNDQIDSVQSNAHKKKPTTVKASEEGIDVNNMGRPKKEIDSLLDDNYVTDKIVNLCKYKCPSCDDIHRNGKSLRQHFRKTGHSMEGQNFRNLNDCVVKKVFHKCKICSEEILCDSENIMTHVKKHNITVLWNYAHMTSTEKDFHKQKYEVAKEENSKKVLYWNESIENVTFSNSVGNLCLYKCKVCNKICQTQTTFRSHLVKTKHEDPAKIMYYNFLTQTTVHKCRICSKVLLCENTHVRDHLRKVHGISSLTQYFASTGISKSYQHVSGYDSNLAKFCSDNASKYEKTSNIGYLCRFSCVKCDHHCQSWAKMKEHLAVSNHGPELSPVQYLAKTTLHECQVCKALLLCDYYFIYRHASKKHNLGIDAYVKKPNVSRVVTEYSIQDYITKLKSYLQKSPAVVGKPLDIMKRNKLPNDKVTSNVGNISFFKCSVCQISDMSLNSLTRHYKVKHQLAKVPDILDHVVEARYHRCGICNTIVLCDNSLLLYHLMNRHKMKLSKYKKEHVLKKGAIVFPTFLDYQRNHDAFDFANNRNALRISQPEPSKSSSVIN